MTTFALNEQLTIYVAGPMRGYVNFNFDAFDEAATFLRMSGHEVLCPADHDRESGFNPTLDNDMDGFDLKAAMRWDLQAVLRSDLVALLSGWEMSEGATMEVNVAEAAGIECVRYADMVADPAGFTNRSPELRPPVVTPSCDDDAMTESITQEAHRLVHGPRQDMYNHPFFDFTRSGRMWGAIIGELKPGEDVSPEKVGLCMVAVKISREVNRPARDNRTDGAGYWDCVDLVQTYKNEKLPA